MRLRIILAITCFQVACYGMDLAEIQIKIDSIKAKIVTIKTKIENLHANLMPLNLRNVVEKSEWFLGNVPSANYSGFYGVNKEFPSIGFYKTPYSFRRLLFSIDAKTATKSPEISEQIRQLSEFKNPQYKKDFFICCWGSFQTDEIGYNSQNNNLIYHGFLAKCLNIKAPLDFKMDVPIGIFSPNGIQLNDLQQNSLKPHDVNFHKAEDGWAFSPNNAIFKIQPNRKIATFWCVAVAPSGTPSKLMSISYNLVANTEELKSKIDLILEAVVTGSDLLVYLTTLANEQSSDDKKALLDFVATINALRKIKA